MYVSETRSGQFIGTQSSIRMLYSRNVAALVIISATCAPLTGTIRVPIVLRPPLIGIRVNVGRTTNDPRW